MLNAALLTTNDQSAWLAALDHADVWSLDNVAPPNRIDEATTALDSGAVDHAKVYEAVGAVYFEEDGRPVTIEPVAGSYNLHTDYSVSFSYLVGNDKVTVKTIPTARSSEAGIAVYGLSDDKEDKEICVSTEYSFYEDTIKINLKSNATDYVASREGKYNHLMTSSLIDPRTGDDIKLSRRDAAILYCYFKAAACDDPKWTVTPLYDDVRILKKPQPQTSQPAKVIEARFN